MASISSRTSLVLDLPPSCIEFVPGHRDLFVVGTYHLERQEGEEVVKEEENGGAQQRSGSLVLFRLAEDEVTKLQTLPTPSAIFDLHFAPPTHSSTPLLGACTSTGTLALYHITSSPPSITHLRTLQLFPPTSLITYFSWHPTIPHLIGATLSDGSTHLCNTSPSSPSATEQATDTDTDTDQTALTVPLHSHDLEAWVLSFIPNPTSTGLLTGGDDSVLKYRRLPAPLFPSPAKITTSSSSSSTASTYLTTVLLHNDDAPSPTTFWSDRRTHTAGVTAILPLPGNLVVTGSYDDRMRLLALPVGALRTPTVLAECDLGGGVWRLKDMTASPNEHGDGSADVDVEGERNEFVLLASCMHAGTRVVRLARSADRASWGFEVLARFEEHASMNYGSDVQDVEEGGEGQARTVVSTSFYDRLLCVWRWVG
ncbi:hypothetical protein K490DRAFT_51538 [Saccharata proteae CBS 121410]|uniref:WD40 repeat-like protein n=1 Tax=Saccharata proteae CBS 121410 TaxID=1314787 RepID=A0A9P4LTX3_9PEZI|nr:hypothetical protein K490DRAFT_51538 [Saccharata proteae CBS 121410]